MILIAGAGLSGLSTAFHLGNREYRLIEKEERPGGLCRTERRGAYSFDYGGHLLHLRSDYFRGFVRELLGERLVSHTRRAAIYSHRVLTRYPFQVHIRGLPLGPQLDCISGFLAAALRRRLMKAEEPQDFRSWILHHFGKGFARHFFFPFNEKFFKEDLSRLSVEWASWSVPRPSLPDALRGALGLRTREFGYNVEFFYPREGIEELPKALHQELPVTAETGVKLMEVIPSEKRAVLSTGEEVRYDKLVCSAALDRFIATLCSAPLEIKQAAAGLRVLSVLCVNLGISGPPLSDLHWIYTPEPELPFHRVGFYSNFMPHEEDKHSLYLEITCPGPLSKESAQEMKEEVSSALDAFMSTPWFREEKHRVELTEPLLIEHGYVVYDEFRRRNLPRVLAWLQEQDIFPVGRYGRWEYSTMEAAVLQGKEVAEKIISKQET